MDAGKNRSLFTGERDSMEFVSRLPAHRGGGGLYMVKLAVSGDGALLFKYLPLNADPELIDDDGNEMVKTAELLTGVKDIRLAYYGKEKNDDDPDWHNEWKITDRLPLLIRLQIDPEDANEFWPELFVDVPAQIERGQPQFALINPKPGMDN